MKAMIHESSFVATKKIGSNTKIWAFVNIQKGATIGRNCNICDHCFIENEVKIGNEVTIKCGVFIWDGITIEDNVFIGPSVCFTNDLRPRSKNYKSPEKTILKKGASIGANSTILAGITIGRYAMTGIGSVITKSVPNHALVFGNPATIHGWVDELGNKLKKIGKERWISQDGGIFVETSEGLLKEKK